MRRNPERTRGALALGVLLTACKPGPTVQAAFDPAAEDTPAGEKGGATPQETDGPDPAESDRRSRMHAHYVAISEIRDALVRGELDRSRSLARELHGRPASEDPDWAPHTRAVREASGLVTDASDLAAAAMAAARLAGECGNCHDGLGVNIDLPMPNPPREAKTVESAMAVHRWAAERMWEGIVFPSAERWIRGTSTFVALPGCGHASETATPVADSEPKCQAVQRVVRRSHDPQELAERTRAYGELLVTCAGCHTSGG